MDNNGKPITIDDNGSFWWGVLGFFFPIIGLVLFIVWNTSKPRSAKAVGIGALIGGIFRIFIPFIIFILIYYLLTSIIGTPKEEEWIKKLECIEYGTNYEPVVEGNQLFCYNRTTGDRIEITTDYNILDDENITTEEELEN